MEELPAAQPHLREGGADVQPRLHRHGEVGQLPVHHLKGLGHEIEFKFFDANE